MTPSLTPYSQPINVNQDGIHHQAQDHLPLPVSPTAPLPQPTPLPLPSCTAFDPDAFPRLACLSGTETPSEFPIFTFSLLPISTLHPGDLFGFRMLPPILHSLSLCRSLTLSFSLSASLDRTTMSTALLALSTSQCLDMIPMRSSIPASPSKSL